MKVPITVYITPEEKKILSKRKISISAWVRSAITLKEGKVHREKRLLENPENLRDKYDTVNKQRKEKYWNNKDYREKLRKKDINNYHKKYPNARYNKISSK